MPDRLRPPRVRKPRTPKGPAPLASFTATYHPNPTLVPCPDCFGKIGGDPCDFCGGSRVVYFQQNEPNK